MGERKDTMNRKTFLGNLERDILEDFADVTYLQERPYTACRIQWQSPSDHVYTTTRFSKVNWPDEWDEEEGKRIVCKRAMYDIWHQYKALELVEEKQPTRRLSTHLLLSDATQVLAGSKSIW